jgi:hypothetical protein
MTPKQRPVKFATVSLPLLCFAVERRVKNTSAYLEQNPTLDENVRRASKM